jgi:hypothetical protein
VYGYTIGTVSATTAVSAGKAFDSLALLLQEKSRPEVRITNSVFFITDFIG